MIKEFDTNIPKKYVFIVWLDQVNNFVLRKYAGNDKSFIISKTSLPWIIGIFVKKMTCGLLQIPKFLTNDCLYRFKILAT